MASKKIEERIKSRRKKILKLNREEKTNKEIAEILRISIGTVYNDINTLKNQGETIKRNISAEIKERKKERREKVLRLSEEGKNKKKIAETLKISTKTVDNDINALEEQGETTIGNKSTQIKNRREKVIRLSEEGKSRKQIAKILKVSVGTVNNDINTLRKQGKSIIGNKSAEVKCRREKVLKLKREGKTREEIAEILRITERTVDNDVNALKKQGKSIIRNKSTQIKNRREKVIRLSKEGKSRKQIAGILRVSVGTVDNDINTLRKKGKGIIGNKHTQIKNRREKVLRLKRKGKTNKEIAEIFEVTERTVISDIHALDEQGIIIKGNTIHYYKQLYKQEKLTKEDLAEIKELVTLTDNYEDIIFYIRACLKLGMFKEAKYQLNTQINNEELTEEQKGKMKELEKQVQLTEQKLTALKMLKTGRGLNLERRVSEVPRVKGLRLNGKNKLAENTNDENDEINR